MRKTDPRAKLKTLPSDIQEALWNWLEEDTTRTLKDAASYLHAEHHITTDFRRLSEWRGWMARKLEIESAESEATEIAQALQHSGQFNAAQLEELGNVIFLNRATKLGDAKTFTAVAQILQGRQRMEAEKAAHGDKMQIAKAKITLDKQRLAQAERKLKLLEAKMTEAGNILSDKALTPEEKTKRMLAVFGR
jgi:hypothetical protein